MDGRAGSTQPRPRSPGLPTRDNFKGDRARYLTAMRKADDGDFGPLGELLARAITGQPVSICDAGSRRTREARATREPREQGEWILSGRASQRGQPGRLKAQKSPSGAWLSSKNWVDDYANGRFKRAP